MAPKNPLVDAIYDCLSSPNETNRNWENANVVEGLYCLARAVRALTKAVERLTPEGPKIDRG